MAYGLADVVNQRRMIDESTAGEAFKRLQVGKLEALLAMAESLDCRRVRLLSYFGEQLGGKGAEGGAAYRCQNCDNCLNPPARWDATDAARKALSCIYRCHQHSGFGFGAGHLIDVLRGKSTEKTRQRGHEGLTTFGIGAELSEAQWRSVVRQLVALGHVVSEGEYHTLALADSARAVLKGEVPIVLRELREAPAKAGGRGKAGRTSGSARLPSAAATLDADGQQRFAALKAWRGEVAREHNLPAYIVFNDATLAQMAERAPSTLAELAGISGVGTKKLEAYGREILRVLGA
jgi:ATP-dependent DNA helicase RecQ